MVRRAFNYEEMAERALEGERKTTIADRRQFTRLFVQVLRDDLADKLRIILFLRWPISPNKAMARELRCSWRLRARGRYEDRIFCRAAVRALADQ